MTVVAPTGAVTNRTTSLRPGHAPLLIPWSDVSAHAEPGRFVRVVVLHFAAEPGVAMRISERLARKLAAETRGAFRID